MPTLYLSNGKALSRTAGSILFGDCRCGYCTPRLYINQTTSMAGLSSNLGGYAGVTYYTYSGGAFTPVTVSSSGAAVTDTLVSLRRKTPCGTEATTGSATMTGHTSGSPWTPGAQLEILGVPIGNMTWRLVVGRTQRYTRDATPQAVSLSFTFQFSTFNDLLQTTSCAQYFCQYGGQTGPDGTPPANIPLGAQDTMPVSTNSQKVVSLTATIPAYTQPDTPEYETVYWWAELDFWLDPAYGQGIINP